MNYCTSFVLNTSYLIIIYGKINEFAQCNLLAMDDMFSH